MKNEKAIKYIEKLIGELVPNTNISKNDAERTLF